MIFAKHPPPVVGLSLSKVNMDIDFPFYYANDAMAHWSGLSPQELLQGRNAKDAFPVDYDRYFEDDVDVCTQFHHPMVKEIIEPWQPTKMDTIVHARKTLAKHADAHWILCCAAPFDDIELGVCRFRASMLPHAFHPLEDVPDTWYDLALDQLPHAMFAVKDAESNTIFKPNCFAVLAQKQADVEALQWARDAGCPWDGEGGDQACISEVHDGFHAMLESCLAKVRAMPNARCWEFGGVRFGGELHRVWIWQPLDCDPALAISFRPHLESVPEVIHSRMLMAAWHYKPPDDEEPANQ